ncbi:MAG: sigma-70 family RNA polymerase sigma factor [Clostridiales bacterium]|nr:sigma-70 family RNA polymerase sigma factor [Clostridiales bacterium]MDY4172730.1 sigma-70 family RNA polymerase sigma factor [Evtepia sp.]
MTEQQIIAWLRQGDPQGMDALLGQYGPLMRYVISPILPNPQDREDCLSEAAMKVWGKIDTFDPQRGAWKSWLTALTRNTALNHARRARWGNRAEALTPDLPSPAPTPEEALLRRERQEAVRAALQKLPAKDRALLYRKYYYRQSTAQIAAELGLTERGVEGRLYRLKRRLRHVLGGELDG